MNKTTRLKKPQIPELEDLYTFDELGGRPKYGGVEMTSETDIPSFQEIMDETHSAVVAEATARDDADDALQAEIDELAGQTSEALEDEAETRAAADTALREAINSEASTRGAADNVLQNQIDAIVASSDVKDIVGTKAELDAYDTSTLGDNDIIKVLQDESQSNATTYYRYTEATDSFTLIGSEGPYYTKGQADVLLNAKADKSTTYTKTEVDATVAGLEADIAAKQDQLTAGSNINIDANNVISGTYTPFTGATASTAGAQGLVPGPLAGDEDKFLKADGTWETVGGALELNYSEYNPTGTRPAPTPLGDWLLSKNVRSGQIVRLLNDNSSSYIFINLGAREGTETDLAIYYSQPEIAFYVIERTISPSNNGHLSVFVSIGAGNFERWSWDIYNGRVTLSAREKLLDASSIRELGQETYEGILSAAAGEELNTIVGAATNISGLSKVDVEPMSETTLTFNQTTNAWDFEWRGTMELDQSTPYDFSQANVGDRAWVYIRDTAGVPLAYTPTYPNDSTYELTDTAGNTINVSGWLYDFQGTKLSTEASIRPGKLMLLEKQATAWRFANSVNDANYLPRVGGGPAVVQTTGTSTTDVMSQNAVTSMVFNDPSSLAQIKIGSSSTSTATRGIAIGYSTQSTGNRAIAIGANAKANGSGISTGNMAIGYNSETTSRGGVALGGASRATADYAVAVGCSSQAQKINSTALGYDSDANGNYSLSLGDTATTSADGAIAIGRNATAATAGSIALGAASSSARKGEMNIGVASGSENTYGYNSSNYRLLTGLYDPQSDHDAATKGYVDTAVASAGAEEINSTDWSALWQ